MAISIFPRLDREACGNYWVSTSKTYVSLRVLFLGPWIHIEGTLRRNHVDLSGVVNNKIGSI